TPTFWMAISESGSSMRMRAATTTDSTTRTCSVTTSTAVRELRFTLRIGVIYGATSTHCKDVTKLAILRTIRECATPCKKPLPVAPGADYGQRLVGRKSAEASDSSDPNSLLPADNDAWLAAGVRDRPR